jgi:hypothetical protein
MQRCPVCLGLRAADTMFRCMHCRREVCEDCRDEVRTNWCRQCARSPREIALAFEADPAAGENGWLIHVRTDLSGENQYADWPCELPVLLGSAQAAEEDQAEGETEESEAEDRVAEAGSEGERLFRAIFAETAWEELRPGLAAEINAGKGVRIRLEDLPPTLAALPWEQLAIPGHPLPHTPVSIVRWQSQDVRTAVLEPTSGPLRILVLDVGVSSTEGQPEPEYDALRAELSEAAEAGLLAIERAALPAAPAIADADAVRGQVMEALRIALQGQGYHVLHLAGSWRWREDPLPGFGWRIDGRELLVPLDGLSLLLQDSSVQLIAWNGGLLRDDGWLPACAMPEPGVTRLLQGNVAGLVAPVRPLDPALFQRFTSALYTALARNEDLEEAVAGARRTLAAGLAPGEESLAWSVPALLRRDWDGRFLDLQPAEAPAAVAAPPVDERLIEERLDDVRRDEAPAQLAEIAGRLREQRLQLIVGPGDAEPFEVGRQAAGALVAEPVSAAAYRYPRYEPLDGFWGCARSVPPDTVLLLDTASLAAIGSEMDALLDLAQQRSLYLLITSTDENATQGDAPLAGWLARQRLLWTRIQAGDFAVEAIQRRLSRQVDELLAAGLLHPATAAFLKKLAPDAAEFAKQRADGLHLPGHVARLLHGPAATPPGIRDEKALRAALQEIAAVPDTIRRWFAGELNTNQQVLAMALALLPGLPLHLLIPFYRAIVERLRRVSHLDLAVLPVRAQLRGWQMYLFEARRRLENGEEAVIVEFRSAQYAAELLDLLRQEYGEWLAEAIPVCGQALLGKGPLEAIEASRSNDFDLRLTRPAVVHALGAIAAGSTRSLQHVADQLEQLLGQTSLGERGRSDWATLALPGQVFAQVADARNTALAGQIRTVLNEWRQRPALNLRLAAASAYGQLARRLPPDRLLTPLAAMAGEAQAAAARITAEQRRKGAADAPALQAAEEVRRAVAHALRWFTPVTLPGLGALYARLAADHDLYTRASVAVALARAAEDPAPVLPWMEGWLGGENWQAWWTGAAGIALLHETGRLSAEEARRLLGQALLGAGRLATGQGKRPEGYGRDLARAISTCLARASDFPEAPPRLKPTLGLLCELLGRDPHADAILRGVFTGLVEPGEQGRPEARQVILEARRAAIEALLATLKPESYRLEATSRKLAIEVLIAADELRRPACQARLRALAEFENFDHRWLRGQDLGSLSLPHLGLGGTLTALLLSGDQATFENVRPFLHQVASIGTNEALRSLAIFVLANLGVARTERLGEVMRVFQDWAAAPQAPVQFSVIDGLLELYARLPADRSEEVLAVLNSVAARLSSRACDYLRERLRQAVGQFNPDAAANLWQTLEARQGALAQEVK